MILFQVLHLATSLQTLTVEATHVFDATDDKLSKTLRRCPHLTTTLREISLSAFQQKIGLTRTSVENLLSHCKNLRRIRNVAYWKISALDLCQIEAKQPDVSVQSAFFLPDKVIPV